MLPLPMAGNKIFAVLSTIHHSSKYSFHWYFISTRSQCSISVISSSLQFPLRHPYFIYLLPAQFLIFHWNSHTPVFLYITHSFIQQHSPLYAIPTLYILPSVLYHLISSNCLYLLLSSLHICSNASFHCSVPFSPSSQLHSFPFCLHIFSFSILPSSHSSLSQTPLLPYFLCFSTFSTFSTPLPSVLPSICNFHTYCPQEIIWYATLSLSAL